MHQNAGVGWPRPWHAHAEVSATPPCLGDGVAGVIAGGRVQP